MANKHMKRCSTSLITPAAAKSLQSCPTVQPHRQQPTRLLRPWDSPGKNTRVGCHFLFQCMQMKSESEVTTVNPMDCSLPGSSVHGKSTGVGCHFLLQCMKVKSESEVAQSCPIFATLWTPTRLLCPWHFPS